MNIEQLPLLSHDLPPLSLRDRVRSLGCAGAAGGSCGGACGSCITGITDT